MNTKTCIVVVGPTAVGKTDLAIRLARHFDTDIISADSRQCFIELNIGVAKPSASQLKEIRHFFINSHHIQEEVNAAVFETISLQYCKQIFKEHDHAIMVGGTGLYVKAFTSGLDEIPPSSSSVRKTISEQYKSNGLEWLQQQLKMHDPIFFEKGETQNPQRMMRALEVKMISGKSIFSFRSEKNKVRDFNIIQIGMDLPREILYKRINERVDEMIRTGLVDEARALLSFRDLNGLQTVGYKELFDYFDGKISLEYAIDLIKQNTRHYAKRQLTWFRKDNSIHWMRDDGTNASIEFVDKLL